MAPIVELLTDGVTWSIEGLTLGVERLWPLLVLPIGLALYWWLLFRRRGESEASDRSRRLVFLSRTLLAVLLVTAAMAPYTVATRQTAGEPRVTMLADESESMGVMPAVADDLASDIEREGVAVSRLSAGSGNRSALGETIGANLQENASMVAVSDGRVTDGQRLEGVAEQAAELNATINTVEVTPNRTERYVTIAGPSKASVGVETQFLIQTDGVRTDFGTPRITVEIDGEEVVSEAPEDGRLEVTHTFEETGNHRVTARIDGQDVYAINDVFRKTVSVVERPEVLYVSRGRYPFENYLDRLYDVTRAESVPEDLDPYYAVVIQDVAAGDLGNVAALQRFAIDGNGVLVVGGNNAYENGDYGNSSIASMLPVSMGESQGGSTDIVLAIDVSGSSEGGMTVQKALALDVLNQLGDENNVGIVAFNFRAFEISEIRSLAEHRSLLEDRIRRLQSGGATEIEVGLRGAEELMGDRRGTVILLSDGGDDPAQPEVVARQLGRDGIQVISVAVGKRIRPETLKRIADASGGTYFQADETNRLRLFFGGQSRQYAGSGLSIVDSNHFITAGVELTADPGQVNTVSVKDGADFLVAAGDGTPALATWRFGLGRVASLTAHDEQGTLGGLRTRPDSLLLTKTVNWAIGDPERKATDTAQATDTRLGEPTEIRYRGTERPTVGDLDFRRRGESVYVATVVPQSAGYEDVLDTTYAVNYPLEYGGFGQSPALETLTETTGGRTFQPSQAAQIAEFAKNRAERVRDVRDGWTWLFLLAAIVLYALEVMVRRIALYRGRTDTIP
jgi:Mg-chelatase subunit ChlD